MRRYTDDEISKVIEQRTEELEHLLKGLREVVSPRWIPVEERLPEDGAEVIVTVDGEGKIDTFVSSDVFIAEEWQNWNGVIAWMPLPDLYRPPAWDSERKTVFTNAEHIRTMTDEELCDFIINGCWGEANKKMEKSEVAEWLRQEDSIPKMSDNRGYCCQFLIPENEDKKERFPYAIGEKAEIFHNGEWKKGKIINGYRFQDGIITIQTEDGETVWCGEDRKDLYRPIS